MKAWALHMVVFPLITAIAVAGCGGGAAAAISAAPTYTPQEKQGKDLFARYCATCHSTVQDEVIVGPSLAGVAARAGTRVEGLGAQEYIQQSIQHPNAYIVAGFDDLMPSTLGETLSGEEVEALVAYLLTLN
jgi:mono/diheme cytochrome c family protein